MMLLSQTTSAAAFFFYGRAVSEIRERREVDTERKTNKTEVIGRRRLGLLGLEDNTGI